MTLRDATDADWETFRTLAARAFPLPENGPKIAFAQVAEHEGNVVAAVIAVRAVEVIAVVNHGASTPAFRWEAIKALHLEADKSLKTQNIDCGYCWLEPTRARGFARKLMAAFGWTEPQWRCLQKKVSL